MKKSELICAIILISFIVNGIISVMVLPFNKELSWILIKLEVCILCFGMCPIALYGIVSLVAYVWFNKNI